MTSDLHSFRYEKTKEVVIIQTIIHRGAELFFFFDDFFALTN